MGRLAAFAVCLLSTWCYGDEWTLSEISQWARRGDSEDVARLFVVCTEADPALAAAALSALRTVPGSEALEALLAAWRHHREGGNSQLDRAALAELRAVYLERSESVARLLSESQRPEVRIAVLALLRALRQAAVGEQARRALREDPAAEVRVFAADLLWQSEGATVLPLLFEVFASERSSDSTLRLALLPRLEAAPAYRERSLRLALLADDADLREAALKALAPERPQWAADELWKLVGSGRSDDVRRGLAGLAVIGNPQDLTLLLPRIPGLPEQAEPELRAMLLARGDAQSSARLLTAARECNSEAIGAACLDVAWSLTGDAADRERLRAQIGVLFDSERPVLCAAAYRLLARLLRAGVQAADDARLIERGLAQVDAGVQKAALDAYGARPDGALAARVVALLDAASCGDAASLALEQAADSAAPALLGGWAALTAVGRTRAARLLGNLATQPGAAAALLQLLADADALVRLAAAEALRDSRSDSPEVRASLQAALGDGYFAVRARAVAALGQMAWRDGERDALRRQLLGLVKLAEPAELEALAVSLRSLGAAEAAGALCAERLCPEPRAAAQRLRLLALLGERTVCEDYLRAACAHADERVAGEAALALYALGSPAGNPRLLELLRDPRPAHKDLAVRALRSLRTRTGQNFGYDPFLPCQGANAEAWRAWRDLLEQP